MSRVNDDATGVKEQKRHLDEKRICNIIVCILVIFILYSIIWETTSSDNYVTLLLFGEKEKLISLWINWITASCVEFYFFWTMYKDHGVPLKWKYVVLFLLFFYYFLDIL